MGKTGRKAAWAHWNAHLVHFLQRKDTAEGRTGLCGQSEGTKGCLGAAWSSEPGSGCGSFKSVRSWPLASLSTGLVVLGAGSSPGIIHKGYTRQHGFTLCITDSTVSTQYWHKLLIFAYVELLVQLIHFLKDYSFVEMQLLSRENLKVRPRKGSHTTWHPRRVRPVKGKQCEEVSSTSALDLLVPLLRQKRRCTEALTTDPLVCPHWFLTARQECFFSMIGIKNSVLQSKKRHTHLFRQT